MVTHEIHAGVDVTVITIGDDCEICRRLFNPIDNIVVARAYEVAGKIPPAITNRID
jgi:hypothetical protein